MYDAIEYDRLATHLLEGRGFVLREGQPYGFRSPGFPFFLMLIYAVVGHSYAAVRLMNALLGAMICLPIYFFVRRIWRWQTGLIAGLGVAAHPLLIYFTAMIYPECLMLLLLGVVFLLTDRVTRSRRIGEVIPLGLLSGFLVYLRPSLLLLGLLIPVPLLLSHGVKKGLLASVVLVVLIGLTILPWSVRNYVVFGEFVWMATEGGVTFWASNNPLATGGWVEPSPETWLEPDPPSNLRGWPDLTETESEARFLAAGIAWIREHPIDFLRLLPRKLVRAWSLNFGNEAREASLPTVVHVAYSLFLIVCLVGLVLSLTHWREAMVLYLLVAVSTLTTLIFYGSTRQSSLLVLPLTVFASLAIERALRLLGLDVPEGAQRSELC